MICDNCKKFFISGNRPDGIPNGVKMLMRGNKSITMCAECLIAVGQMNQEQKDEFFEQLKNKEQTEKSN
jgi:UDP-glucose 6-dehydrogenase